MMTIANIEANDIENSIALFIMGVRATNSCGEALHFLLAHRSII